MTAKLATTAVTILLAAGALAPVASAQGVENVPVTPDCSGVLITDDTGDTSLHVAPVPQPDNQDIKAAWLRYDIIDGEPAVTVNIQVANLDKTVPAGADNVRWYFYFPDGDGVTQSVIAQLAGGAFTFHYGHIGTDGNAVDGTTTGRAIEGSDGVLQIQLPSARVEVGTKISGAYVQTQPLYTAILPTNDRAPDSGTGKPYTIQPCPGAAAPVVPGAPAAPAPPAGPAKPANTSLPVKLASAKAKPKGRALAVRLSSSERCQSLSAKLTRGGRTYGTGRLTAINGRGTLKIKLGKSKPRKGTYTLTLTGRDSSGAKLKRTLRLRIA